MTSSWIFLPSALLKLSPSSLVGWVAVAVLALAGIFVAVFAYTRTLPELSPSRRWILTTLRGAVLALLLFMLLQPVLIRTRSETVLPGVLLLVDVSKSMGLKNDAGVTRLEEARRLTASVAGSLKKRNSKVEVFVERGARRVWPEGAHPPGDGTNLPALLLSGAQRHLKDNLQAILLFSDGVSTDRELPSLAGLSTVVYTVAVGDSSAGGDLRLDRVHYPPLAFRGEKIEIDAETVVEDARPGHGVALLMGGARVDSVSFSWPAGGGRFSLRFTVATDSLGLLRRSLRLRPLLGEALLENNEVELALQVRKERLHVMLVEGRPSWDFHFLRRRFAKDPRFLVEGVYRKKGGFGFAASDSAWTPPATLQEAKGVDVWVMASLDDLAGILPLAPGIEASVNAGAGMLTIFGEPRRRTLGPVPQRARELLPLVVEAGARWVDGEHRVELTATGISHPILDFPPAVGSAASRLSAMPPLWEAVHGVHPKADADVLLQLRGGDATTPLLVLSRFGKGITASWTAAPLWSWSYWRLGGQDNEDVYFALTGNLFFYLAEGGERTRLRLILPRSVVAAGEDLLVRGVVLDSRLQPDESSDLWLEWRKDDIVPGDSTAVATGRALMEEDPSTAGSRWLELPALPPGSYLFRVALEEHGGRIVSPWRSLLVDPYSVEYRRPRVDAAALSQIARAQGGRRIEAPDLERWAAQLPLKEKTRVQTRRLPLWASLVLFLPLILLLSLEWGLRRRWGLI